MLTGRCGCHGWERNCKGRSRRMDRGRHPVIEGPAFAAPAEGGETGRKDERWAVASRQGGEVSRKPGMSSKS